MLRLVQLALLVYIALAIAGVPVRLRPDPESCLRLPVAEYQVKVCWQERRP